MAGKEQRGLAPSPAVQESVSPWGLFLFSAVLLALPVWVVVSRYNNEAAMGPAL